MLHDLHRGLSSSLKTHRLADLKQNELKDVLAERRSLLLHRPPLG